MAWRIRASLKDDQTGRLTDFQAEMAKVATDIGGTWSNPFLYFSDAYKASQAMSLCKMMGLNVHNLTYEVE
jgi:hypothetical protein